MLKHDASTPGGLGYLTRCCVIILETLSEYLYRKEKNINSQDVTEMGVRGKRLNCRILIPAVDENIIFKKAFNQKQNNTSLFWCLIFQPVLITSLSTFKCFVVTGNRNFLKVTFQQSCVVCASMVSCGRWSSFLNIYEAEYRKENETVSKLV